MSLDLQLSQRERSASEQPMASVTRRRSTWRQILITPLGLVSSAMLGGFVVLAVMAPMLWTHRAEAVNTSAILNGPSARHWLGTDQLGRDVFIRVLVATRLSLELAVLASAIGTIGGLALGIAAVLAGRRLGQVLTAAVNLALSFPGLLLILFFSVIFGVGIEGALLSIGIAFIPVFARLTQTLAASVVETDYVAAARLAGVNRVRLAMRHIVPNIGEPVIVNATTTVAGVLLSFAALSFLGLGVRAPRYDWGELLNDGLSNLYQHPAAAIGPGVAVVLASLAFNLFGEVLAKQLGSNTSLSRQARRAQRSRNHLRRVGTGRRKRAAAEGPASGTPVLVVNDLRVSYPGTQRPVVVVRGVSFTLKRGEAVGVVGESGSGKSQMALAVAQLSEYPARIEAERLDFNGRSLSRRPDRDLNSLLGTSMAMVFQDPLSALNPRMKVGAQLAEVAVVHQHASRRQAGARAVQRLREVGVAAAGRRALQLPHEFSGGMRQRAIIGMGLMGEPSLVIADEPTTALDVTVQRRVLALLEAVRADRGAAVLLISHDISVIAQFCDRILVMYAGRIVEELPTQALNESVRHPYTQALLSLVPTMHTDRHVPLATIPGRPPRPAEIGVGCAYAPRCPLVIERCRHDDPPLREVGGQARVACWRAEDTSGRLT